MSLFGNQNKTPSLLMRILKVIYWIIFAIALVIVLVFIAFKIFVAEPDTGNNEIIVNPDVVIKLPNRQESAIKKPAPRKRTPTPEEQLQQVKKTNRLLIIILCLMAVLVMLLAYLSFDFFRQLDVQSFLGQNYSTVETTR